MKKLVIGLTVGMLIGSSTVALAATNVVQASLQKFRIIVNGETQVTASNQLLYKGTTYVPIRETADLLHYGTYYDAKSKTIEFNTKPNSNEWISLLDLQAFNNNIAVNPIEGKDGGYEVKKSDKVLLTIFGGDLKDGDQAVVHYVNDEPIQIQKKFGALLLNKRDLSAVGFKVN